MGLVKEESRRTRADSSSRSTRPLWMMPSLVATRNGAYSSATTFEGSRIDSSKAWRVTRRPMPFKSGPTVPPSSLELVTLDAAGFLEDLASGFGSGGGFELFNAGEQVFGGPGADEGAAGWEAGDPVAEKGDGFAASTCWVTRGGIWPRPRVERRCSRTERSGAPGATSMAFSTPKVSCWGRASMSFMSSRGRVISRSIWAFPPPALMWQTAQLTWR